MEPYFHEDSFLCYEFTSVNNVRFINEAFTLLTALEDEERNSWEMVPESEQYFTTRPIGGNRPVPTFDLAIMISDLTTKLISHGFIPLAEPDFVKNSTFRSYRSIIQNASCFVYHNFAIFLYAENDRITYLWFDSFASEIEMTTDNSGIINFLYAIGVDLQMVLVDWYEKRIIDLTQKDVIADYLATLKS
ncbi:hypothetical protein [Flavobacterium sp. CAU 1735]|uniref:hypothetical protein n=1 Tax=Flavobacterium sp. CAU 1735 TaxID=3140361 RepID=UPI003261A54C